METFQIGQIIQNKRKKQQLTQSDLATVLGISKSSVSKWETGLTYPDIYLLPRLATFFNLSIDELLGYQPQLTKEEIADHYRYLANQFASEPFEQVITECRNLIQRHYACIPFLLQMAILLINHANLASGDQSSDIVREGIKLVQRVKQESTDSPIINQANSLEAACQMLLNEPEEVLELLGREVNLQLGDEQLLATAYQLLGEQEKSIEVMQVTVYQQLLSLLSTSSKLLQNQVEEELKFDQTVERTRGISHLYQVKEFHPLFYVTLLLEMFLGYSQQGRLTLGLDVMEEMCDVLSKVKYPAQLQGDAYFDRIEPWIKNKLVLSETMPRNEKIVKDTFLTFFNEHPLIQERYGDNPRFKKLAVNLATILTN